MAGEVTRVRRVSWSKEPDPPPGWYTDPDGPGQRWWDGQRWTDHVSDVEFVLHPPAAYVPRHPVPPQPAPVAPAPKLERSRPDSPPALFWALPALVVLMIAGAAGTWMSVAVGGETVRTLGGLEEGGDGWLVVLAALVATVVLAAWVFERVILLPIVGMITGLGSASMALYRAVDPAAGEVVTADVEVTSGWGVWLALVASLAVAGVSAGLALATGARPRDEGRRR
jgi:hypothetical protein